LPNRGEDPPSSSPHKAIRVDHKIGFDAFEFGGEAIVAEHPSDPAREIMATGVVGDHLGFATAQFMVEVVEVARRPPPASPWSFRSPATPSA
jgi:hypothetical protein